MGIKVSENAMRVLEKRYLKEVDGVIETVEGMFKRVANTIAAANPNHLESADLLKLTSDFYDIMTSFKFLPNTPTLVNAGRKDGQLSACFVLPIDDSIKSIFETMKNSAIIHQSGGGTGFDFSSVRAKGSKIRSSGFNCAAGPVAFIRLFDSVTEVIKQGGVRKGASIGILRVDHPDIEEFIKCKREEGSIANFNLSVAVTDEFMNALMKNSDYKLSDGSYLYSKRIWDLLVKGAWENGEPGIIFIDKINEAYDTLRTGGDEKIQATNPCGEQPLLSYESCNLGSINLSKFVKDGEIDYHDLANTVELAVKFLDNVITANSYPLYKIREKTLATRKIGLGVMGFADMLIKLGVEYGSDASLNIARNIMEYITTRAMKASNGRNETVTTIAPTGSISIIANCSSGIEPYYALSYKRNVIDDELYEVNEYLKENLAGLFTEDSLGYVEGERVWKYIEENGQLPEDGLFYEYCTTAKTNLIKLFKTANQIPYKKHIAIQAAFQAYTHNAVSKTINLPYEATLLDVHEAFILAYNSHCKGITLYRDGSRNNQVLERVTNNTEEKIEEKNMIEKQKRPDCLNGSTYRKNTACGSLYITINKDRDGNIKEVFCIMGKAGECEAAINEAVARLVSTMLQHNIKLEIVVQILQGIRCAKAMGIGPNKILSCPDVLARTLAKVVNLAVSTNLGKNNFCPDCGNTMVIQENCMKCNSCGYSRCE